MMTNLRFAAALGLALSVMAAREAGAQTGIPAGVPQALARERAASIKSVQYALSLDVTRRDTALGTVVVQFRRTGARDVVLDFRGLRVDSVIANGTSLDAKSPAVWDRAHVRIPARALRVGVNSLRIVFASPIAAAGASIIRTRDATDGSEYVYTLLVPSDANLLFPCFDQPDLKARLSLTLTTPRGWSALGNGRSVGIDSTSSSVRVHQFAESRPLSTYLMAFAAGPWATVTRNLAIRPGAAATPVSLWVRRSRLAETESDSLIAMNARALVWLGDWFGIPYAFDKFDLLLAPAFPFGGMEHPGAVFYNEESFIYRERPTVSQLLGRQATTYHEVAHQWFGNYMTMRWFDDLWLKEGFATYMAAKMQSSLDPSSNAWKTFYLRNKPVAYNTDASAGTTPVWQTLANLDQAKSNYGPIVYNKAPGVLRQLEYTVGERAFRQGVSAFLTQHGYGNATWRDLLASIGTAAGRNLSSWGAQWILRPGMPIVEQHVRVANGRIASLRLTQRPAQPSLSGAGAWPLAMQLVLYHENGETVRLPVRMNQSSLEVTAAVGQRAPAFVFANDSDYGYAIVLPDSASVRWLESHVETIRGDFLRAMMWGAMWDLVRESGLSPTRYAQAVLRALPTEADEQVATGLVGRLSTALTRYSADEQRDALLPAVERVLLAGAADTTRPYGLRKAQVDAYIGIARSPSALARIDAWLTGDTLAGLPLRPPTRWSIVTRLIARDAPSADARLVQEMRRDSTTEGKRQAFVAGAARPLSEAKQAYFTQWFGDRSLNEEWVTSSLRAFHDAEQSDLTRPYLVPALDTLPWIQQNRRIFFLGSWLGATIGGQRSPEALAQLDAWLAAHPRLAPDLRQKILQARDELERTNSIRRTFEPGVRPVRPE